MSNYACAACGGTFERIRPEPEAIEECERLFPGEQLEEAAIICDDCFNEMQTFYGEKVQ